MLVRSASTPILKSWVPSHSIDLSPEPQLNSLPTSSFKSTTTCCEYPRRMMTRSRSENNLRDLAVVQKRSPLHQSLTRSIDEEEEELGLKLNSRRLSITMGRLFSSTGLDELVEEEYSAGGGSNCGGGRVNGGGGGDGFSGDSNDENDSTDAYYQKMIKSDPENSLLLGNYAKFLKEVRCDLVKAEEYCERAVLANPNDGKVVSFYADLIWEVHKDASRAEKYFDQAIQAEPNDCYVMAAYARFLWNTEEEEEEEEEGEEIESCKSRLTSPPPNWFQGITFPAISAY